MPNKHFVLHESLYSLQQGKKLHGSYDSGRTLFLFHRKGKSTFCLFTKMKWNNKDKSLATLPSHLLLEIFSYCPNALSVNSSGNSSTSSNHHTLSVKSNGHYKRVHDTFKSPCTLIPITFTFYSYSHFIQFLNKYKNVHNYYYIKLIPSGKWYLECYPSTLRFFATHPQFCIPNSHTLTHFTLIKTDNSRIPIPLQVLQVIDISVANGTYYAHYNGDLISVTRINHLTICAEQTLALRVSFLYALKICKSLDIEYWYGCQLVPLYDYFNSNEYKQLKIKRIKISCWLEYAPHAQYHVIDNITTNLIHDALYNNNANITDMIDGSIAIHDNDHYENALQALAQDNQTSETTPPNEIVRTTSEVHTLPTTTTRTSESSTSSMESTRTDTASSSTQDTQNNTRHLEVKYKTSPLALTISTLRNPHLQHLTLNKLNLVEHTISTIPNKQQQLETLCLLYCNILPEQRRLFLQLVSTGGVYTEVQEEVIPFDKLLLDAIRESNAANIELDTIFIQDESLVRDVLALDKIYYTYIRFVYRNETKRELQARLDTYRQYAECNPTRQLLAMLVDDPESTPYYVGIDSIENMARQIHDHCEDEEDSFTLYFRWQTHKQ
jgi:hypothetical protein